MLGDEIDGRATAALIVLLPTPSPTSPPRSVSHPPTNKSYIFYHYTFLSLLLCRRDPWFELGVSS